MITLIRAALFVQLATVAEEAPNLESVLPGPTLQLQADHNAILVLRVFHVLILLNGLNHAQMELIRQAAQHSASKFLRVCSQLERDIQQWFPAQMESTP